MSAVGYCARICFTRLGMGQFMYFHYANENNVYEYEVTCNTFCRC